MMFVSLYVGIYYNVIITYTIYYLFRSFTKTLPWTHCNHDWNTIYCNTRVADCFGRDANLTALNGTTSGIIIGNGSCVTIDELTDRELRQYNVFRSGDLYDATRYNDPLFSQRVRASEEFFK